MANMIMFKCKRHFNIMDIDARDRHKKFIECRRAIIFFFYKYTDLNVYQMAKMLGLSRCTVLFHYKKIQEFIDCGDKDTDALLHILDNELQELI